jgi:hypothetical protein
MRAALIPVADKLDDGMARRGFALQFAGNLARTLVFVNADRSAGVDGWRRLPD